MAKPASKSRTLPDSARLTRDDWLDAAFRAVVDGGFDKVRVLILADTLSATPEAGDRITIGSDTWTIVPAGGGKAERRAQQHGAQDRISTRHRE